MTALRGSDFVPQHSELLIFGSIRMKNLSYCVYFSFMNCWETFGWKMGVAATTRAPNTYLLMVWGSKPDKKVDLLGALLNQYSPVPRARSSTAGKDATRQRAARAQIYASLGTGCKGGI